MARLRKIVDRITPLRQGESGVGEYGDIVFRGSYLTSRYLGATADANHDHVHLERKYWGTSGKEFMIGAHLPADSSLGEAIDVLNDPQIITRVQRIERYARLIKVPAAVVGAVGALLLTKTIAEHFGDPSGYTPSRLPDHVADAVGQSHSAVEQILASQQALGSGPQPVDMATNVPLIPVELATN